MNWKDFKNSYRHSYIHAGTYLFKLKAFQAIYRLIVMITSNLLPLLINKVCTSRFFSKHFCYCRFQFLTSSTFYTHSLYPPSYLPIPLKASKKHQHSIHRISFWNIECHKFQAQPLLDTYRIHSCYISPFFLFLFLHFFYVFLKQFSKGEWVFVDSDPLVTD